MKLHNVSSHMYIYKHGIIELKSILLVQHHSSCMWAVVPLFFFFVCVCVYVCVCFSLGEGGRVNVHVWGEGVLSAYLYPYYVTQSPLQLISLNMKHNFSCRVNLTALQTEI